MEENEGVILENPPIYLLRSSFVFSSIDSSSGIFDDVHGLLVSNIPIYSWFYCGVWIVM